MCFIKDDKCKNTVVKRVKWEWFGAGVAVDHLYSLVVCHIAGEKNIPWQCETRENSLASAETAALLCATVLGDGSALCPKAGIKLLGEFVCTIFHVPLRTS